VAVRADCIDKELFLLTEILAESDINLNLQKVTRSTAISTGISRNPAIFLSKFRSSMRRLTEPGQTADKDELTKRQLEKV
jgi:hypothetical protein